MPHCGNDTLCALTAAEIMALPDGARVLVEWGTVLFDSYVGVGGAPGAGNTRDTLAQPHIRVWLAEGKAADG